jgi:glutamine amidotransferase
LNGDGFGVGWYSEGVDPTPCLFTSLTPAWSNRNLRRLAVRIRSGCFFAHVRAATPGSIVSEQNCHPFRAGRFLWMHNGYVAGFDRVARRLRAELRDDLYGAIKGTTDSEHAFYLFLNELTGERAAIRRSLEERLSFLRDYRSRFFDLLHDPGEGTLDEATFLDRMVEHFGEFTPDALAGAMLRTLERLNRLQRAAGTTAPSKHNFAVTDGRTILVTRYADRESASGPSLYRSVGMSVGTNGGPPAPAVLVASERLTEVHDDWEEIPPNHLLAILPDCTIELAPIGLEG